MSMGRKLIQKLVRRMKSVKERAAGQERYEKGDKLDEVMKDSPGVYRAMIHPQRKADGSSSRSGVGIDVLMKKPRLEYKAKASTLERFDYGGAVYGIRATMPAGLIADSRVQPGDVVEVLSGVLASRYLSVVALTDSTHLRLEDSTAAAYAGAKEKTSVTLVADVAGSLNSKYWLLSKPGTNYYVWYNINGAGVDPAVGGRTGIMVAAATGASAATLATATKAALDAIVGAWTTSAVGGSLTVEDQAVGTATDAADGGAPTGFTISVLTQGAAANPTPAAETNKYLRIQLSSTKKSYA